MRTYLLLLLTLLSITNAKAYEGGLQETFSPSLDSRELENKVKYEYLKTEYETKRVYSAGLTTCALKNKYYMPGNGSADADGCYDVIGYLNNKGLFGTEATVIGSAIAVTDSKLDTIDGAGRGRFLADYKCSQANAGSRAMRAGDIKYLSKSNTIPVGANNILLFDAVSTIDDSTNLLYGYSLWGVALSGNSATCEAYSYNAGDKDSIRVENHSGGGIRIKKGTCSSAARIICVND